MAAGSLTRTARRPTISAQLCRRHKALAGADSETPKELVVRAPTIVDVKAIRAKTGMSQQAFALRFGFSHGAVRDWEQHRRQPEAAARALLLVINYNPDVVAEALAAAAH